MKKPEIGDLVRYHSGYIGTKQCIGNVYGEQGYTFYLDNVMDLKNQECINKDETTVPDILENYGKMLYKEWIEEHPEYII